MWSLIKAELSYNRHFLAWLYPATIAMWVIYLFDPASMFQIFGVPALFLMIALFTRAAKEKRERFHALLPVSLQHHRLAGLLMYAVFFHAGILSGWATQFLRKRPALANEFITFCGVLTLNGLTISIFFLLAIRFDLKHHNEKKYFWIANSALAAALLITFSLYFLANFSARNNPAIYGLIRDLVLHSPAVAVAANAVCAGLMYLSTVIYAGRKSYLA
jgi:hypothetical protein